MTDLFEVRNGEVVPLSAEEAAAVLAEREANRAANEARAAVEADRQRVRGTLDARMRAALGDIATYLALATPTNAQNTAQIRRLSRAVAALIRDARPDLQVDSTDI